MFIEQIVEFELRGPGPPRRTCTRTTGCFYDKTKISKENLVVDLYFLLNHCMSILLSLTRAKSLTKFNPKILGFKRVLEGKRRFKQFNFFNRLLNVKNVVLSEGSEHVRIVIQ